MGRNPATLEFKVQIYWTGTECSLERKYAQGIYYGHPMTILIYRCKVLPKHKEWSYDVRHNNVKMGINSDVHFGIDGIAFY